MFVKGSMEALVFVLSEPGLLLFDQSYYLFPHQNIKRLHVHVRKMLDACHIYVLQVLYIILVKCKLFSESYHSFRGPGGV